MKNPQVPLCEEEKDYEGGINIAAAQKRMREEDKVDRRIERDRIKKMHRVCAGHWAINTCNIFTQGYILLGRIFVLKLHNPIILSFRHFLR